MPARRLHNPERGTADPRPPKGGGEGGARAGKYNPEPLGENDKIGHISTFGNFSIFALSSIYLKISGFQAVIRITIPDMDEWLKNVENILVDSYGLARDFAGDASRLLAYLFQYGLNPRITRGWSSPEHQKELQARWDRGDRAGLRVRPASSSEHTAESWGQPAARAIDIVTDNDVTAAQIARALKIGTGMDFKTPDAGHFFAKA